MNPLTRVLVVDDFGPFRRFVLSILQQQPQLQIIGEASDGIEAVQKVQKLKPDLVLLDVGLPKLNGIDAGERIFALFPYTKILFISQETSIDVVHRTLAIGASGYISKIDAASELLQAVNAVLHNELFIGRRFTEYNFAEVDALNRKEAYRHEVAFYSDDQIFLDDLTYFVEVALNAGNAVILIVTESHRNGLFPRLQAHGMDIDSAVAQGRYILLNVDEAFPSVMSNETLDASRDLEPISSFILAANRTVKNPPIRVAIFGEGVNLMCAQGKIESAIQIEKLCNQLMKVHDIDIWCAYFLNNIPGGTGSHIYQQICAEHSAVFPQGFSVRCT